VELQIEACFIASGKPTLYLVIPSARRLGTPSSSFARGEATEASDIDMAVIIDDSINAENVEKELSDFLFDILLDRKELISVFAIPESIYENYNSPFILNTKAEGVTI